MLLMLTRRRAGCLTSDADHRAVESFRALCSIDRGQEKNFQPASSLARTEQIQWTYG